MKKKVCVFLYLILLGLALTVYYGPAFLVWLLDLTPLELFAIGVASLYTRFLKAWELTSVTPPRSR